MKNVVRTTTWGTMIRSLCMYDLLGSWHGTLLLLFDHRSVVVPSSFRYELL
ncbi:hypothetical protein DSM100238_1541 [Bifidobacterium apri]|uniref:Uncharacterized protein n=1 Tax=Bifidobacterium apri TaxID=1769423 RepID=A0A6A2V7V2_9BIFI|nr:hypothetical protein DSM100238_1541 [Bifidobacterium apri]